MEPKPKLSEPTDWQASERTRQWLLFGIFAAFIDGGLHVISTVLEVQFWEQEGLTPDMFVAYAAMLPQMVLLAAYLTLAKDADGRGLWKGAAGFFACGWLGLFLLLATYETLPRWLTVSVSIASGLGIVGLVIFLFGKWPTFQSEQVSKAPADGDVKVEDSEGPGCVGHFILGGVLLAVRMLLKNNKKWLWWVPGDVESWAFLEMLVVMVLIVVFGVWFALTKIRLRHKLGSMATALGSTELLIAALHLTMIAVGIGALIVTVVDNPNIDDAAMEKLFASKAKMAMIVSGASYCFWSVITMLFFASVRRRGEPDWRVEFQTDNNARP